MAKLGNEAKLIIKLAHERMGKRQLPHMLSESSEDFQSGYNQSIHEYHQELLNIATELEGSK